MARKFLVDLGRNDLDIIMDYHNFKTKKAYETLQEYSS